MTNYSHIKLSDHFYPQSTYPPGLVAYYKGTELSGALIDTLGNFDLPIIGSGTVGGDGITRGTFCGNNTTDNPNPSAFGLLDSTKSLALLDTNVHTSFMYEVVVTVPTIPNILYSEVLLRLPRALYLTMTYWTAVNFCFSFNKSSGYTPVIPATANLTTGTYYVTIVCLGTGTNELAVYINKTQSYLGTFVASTNDLNCLSIGAAYDSSSPNKPTLGIYDARIKEIAIHNSIASFEAAEALMAKRMTTADASAIISYPV